MKKLGLTIAAILIAACSRDIQNTDAVRQGVLDYLKARTAQTGLDMNMMQVDVTSVSFQASEARATVAFRPKTGGSGNPMMMNYTLDRKGGKWVVRGRTENGVNPHGTGALPGTTPSQNPAENPDAPALPPNHPPVSPKQ